VVEIPVDSVVALSTTHLPHLAALERLDHLVAVDSFLYPNTPQVLEMIAAGEVVEVGAGLDINLEVMLDLEPNLVLTDIFDPNSSAYSLLSESGIFSAINSDWLEPSLLGRAEWIKFISAFFNDEAEATAIYDAIVTEYETVADLASSIPDEERLTVLWNSYTTFTESWTIPGQETWVGELLSDAGVNWVLMDEVPEGSQDFSFEAVFEAGADAPLWVVNAFLVETAADLAALDERFTDFAAFQNSAIYNDTARTNANGGNDFWETGVTNPHLLIKDLVKLFYPDLLPDHELVFYKPLS
jgi:iron complex transport system substrate-binding protein